MIRIRFHAVCMQVLLSVLVVIPSANLYSAESLNDLKAKRAMSQSPPDWRQALTHFQAAYAQDRTNIERYYFIANCLQNTNHPLPAMAWYQAYLAAPDSDPQRTKLVRNQVGLLEIDVRSKLGFLFTEAVSVGEKLIKGKVAPNGVAVKYTRHLFSLPKLQAECGMLAEALATQKRIDALGVMREYNTVQTDFRYGGLGYFHSPQGWYLFAEALAGDATAVKDELPKVSGEAVDKESQKSLDYLSELVRYNLSQEKDYRLALAEQIARDDPMENLDARADQILMQKDREKIPEALGELAKPIGQSYLKVRAMRPENSKPELSNATRQFAIGRVRGMCTNFWIRIDSKGTEFDRLIARAVSRFDINEAHILSDGMRWPYIAWTLKGWKDGKIDGKTIAFFLTENGMGVNESISTADKKSLGNRPLHWAVEWHNLLAVEVLLANKADPRIKNGRGFTPLDLALEPSRNVEVHSNINKEIIRRLQQAIQNGFAN